MSSPFIEQCALGRRRGRRFGDALIDLGLALGIVAAVATVFLILVEVV